MTRYLFIESRDPYESRDCARFWSLAAELRKAGNEVTLFLVQNGVLACRPGERTPALADALKAGVDVVADDFSLRERGISAAELRHGFRPAPLDLVIDQLAEGRKALWH